LYSFHFKGYMFLLYLTYHLSSHCCQCRTAVEYFSLETLCLLKYNGTLSLCSPPSYRLEWGNSWMSTQTSEKNSVPLPERQRLVVHNEGSSSFMVHGHPWAIHRITQLVKKLPLFMEHGGSYHVTEASYWILQYLFNTVCKPFVLDAVLSSLTVICWIMQILKLLIV
jgi:hypothetical protein